MTNVLSSWALVVTVMECGFITDSPQLKKYDPKTSIWTDCAPLQVRRRNSAVCTLKGNIYVIGIIPLLNASCFHNTHFSFTVVWSQNGANQQLLFC